MVPLIELTYVLLHNYIAENEALNRELACVKAKLANQRFYIQALEQQNNKVSDKIHTYSMMIIRALKEQLQRVESSSNVLVPQCNYDFYKAG